MKRSVGIALTVAVAISVASAASLGMAANGRDDIVYVENRGDKLLFHPLVEHQEMILTVAGPCDFHYRQVFANEKGWFRLTDETIDGAYTFNVTMTSRIDPDVIEALLQARKYNDDSVAKRMCREGRLPGPPPVQSGGFFVDRSEIIYDLEMQEKRTKRLETESLSNQLARLEAPENQMTVAPATMTRDDRPTKDFVINDDLIVDGSACVGFDCVNGESFGFDTIRLKENNLRIKFDDTSVAASFPRTDWQLTANSSANGGASKFSIDDISGGRTPFTVEANARSHSLYVDDGGRIGSRTSTPSTEIHTIDGDTPTLRLQQDGSSGFAPQTWDVAGNETNFFVRDVTNGSTLPFRIRPGAPTSSIFIDVDGDVGMGTSSPDNSVHVRRTDGTAMVLVEEESSTVASRDLLELSNNGDPRMVWRDTDAGAFWRVSVESNANSFVVTRSGTGSPELTLDNNGNLDVRGTISSGGTQLDVPDYVFEPDYQLMPIGDLHRFVNEHRHLPGVPSAADIKKDGLRHDEFQMALLKKVEELTLYTLAQEKALEEAHQRIAATDAVIRELMHDLEELRANRQK
jgi:hypothetical protein